MAGLSNRLLLIVKDHWGTFGKVAVYVAAATLDPSGAAVQAIKDAINLLSKAVVTKESITVSLPSPGTGPTTTGVFSDSGDKLVLEFVDTDAQTHLWEVPAPQSGALDWANTPDGIHPGPAAYGGVEPLQVLIDAVEEVFTTVSEATLSFVDARVVRRSI